MLTLAKYQFWGRVLAMVLGFTLFANASLKGQTALFQTMNLPDTLEAKRLCQDGQGFLWIGGNKGLYRYDGFEYESIALPDSLAFTEISAFLVDEQEHLWVGFANGELLEFSLGLSLRWVSRHQVSTAPIKDISLCAAEQIWVATAGDGLWYHVKQKGLWEQVKGLPDDYLYTLINGPDQMVWVGTDRGIAIVNPATHQLVEDTKITADFQNEIVQALLPVEDGSVWIGTYDGGLAKYDQAFHEVAKIALPSIGAIRIMEKAANGIWIGTEREGLFWLGKAGDLQKISSKPLLRIQDILYDRDGNIWTLDQQHGLRIAPAFFTHIPLEESIQALYAASDKIWYATAAGVSVYLPQSNQHQALDLPLQGRVLSLYQDSKDYLWIGTQGDGVWHLSPDLKTWQHITEKEGLISNHILSISEGADSIWFATFGGVASCPVREQIDPATFRLYNQADGLGVNYIYQTYMDTRRRLWFATDGKGVRLRQNQQFEAIKGAQRKTILGIAEDKDQNLWFHVQDDGVWRLEGDSIRSYQISTQSQMENFSALLTDGKGRLLMGGENGLMIYDPKDKNLRQFGPEQDFPSLGSFLNLMAPDPKGNIWIGTQEGLICYKPALLPIKGQLDAQIKGIGVLLEAVSAEPGIQFLAEENHISFKYAAPWYQNQSNVAFEHRLIGFDIDWVRSRNREVIYPRLAPGKYTFELRASNQADFAQANLTQFDFEIRRPLWQSWWFGVLIGLVLIGGTLAWIRIRENRLRRTEGLEKAYLSAQFETLKSQVNPHFLFNSFNTLAAIIEEQPKEAVAYVEHLSDLFRNILEYRKQTVISIGEELDLLDKFYYLQSHRYHDNFVLHIAVDMETRLLGIPPMSLQLLVENALKHNVVSKRQPLTVYIETTKPGYLSVRNSLQLRRDHRPSTKLGQQNIRQRYQLLGKEAVQIETIDQHYCVHLPLLTSPEL